MERQGEDAVVSQLGRYYSAIGLSNSSDSTAFLFERSTEED